MARQLRFILTFYILTVASTLSGQTNLDFKQAIQDKKFTPVNTKKIPVEILTYFGYDSYDKVGGRNSVCGCTGPRLRINWAVTDNEGFWVLQVERCGAWNEIQYAVIANNSRYGIDMRGDLKTFKEFREAYLNKPTQ